MRHMLFRMSYVIFVGLLVTIVAVAQTATCPTIVQSALDSADEICQETGRNQACYVNLQAEVTPQDPTIRLKFDQPGDRINLEYVSEMIMSPMNTIDNTWGVSLMKVQANLPDTVPGQNVTMLLFGDVEIRNEVSTDNALVTLTGLATTNANVRVAPSTTASVLKSLEPDESVTVDGRNSDGTWIRIQVGGNQSGWVFSELITVDGDVMSLKSVVAGEQSTTFNPMQAFYIKTGIGDSACDEAPESGIMIQTPSGSQKVNLTVNGVDISLGSTAYIQAQPEQAFSMAVLEGEGTLTVDGATVIVPAGSQSIVPLDENGEPAGEPEPATAYDADRINKLPIRALEEDIEIASPLTDDALAMLQDAAMNDPVPAMQPPMMSPIMHIPGLPAECMEIINEIIVAANNYDVNALEALEARFVSSGCEEAAEALANTYADYDDSDFADDGSESGD